MNTQRSETLMMTPDERREELEAEELVEIGRLLMVTEPKLEPKVPIKNPPPSPPMAELYDISQF